MTGGARRFMRLVTKDHRTVGYYSTAGKVERYCVACAPADVSADSAMARAIRVERSERCSVCNCWLAPSEER